MPEISVIIPVYNAEAYLSRCLESLIMQSFTDWEALLVDDGSTDGSLAILQKFSEADLRFKVISQQNSGQSVARNKALSLAQGRYVSFVDADDWIERTFLQRLYESLEESRADIAFASIVKTKGIGGKDKFRVKEKKLYYTPQEKYRAFGMPENCFIWNKLYRKSKLNLSFIEGMYYEDLVFSHQVLWAAGAAVSVPGTQYYYFSNPASTVNVYSEQKRQDYKRALELSLQLMAQNGMKANVCAYSPIMKKDYKLFGIKFLTIKDWGVKKCFYAFGLFKVKEVRN